jgi:YegS/Rv2252/BmrU family lipid kinase
MEPSTDRAARTEAKASFEAEIRGQRRAALVVNTHSRRGGALLRQAEKLLIGHGFRLDAVYPVRQAERLPDIVREAIHAGHRYIIVGGGDGSISSVVDHFAHTTTVFGLLPLGTANSFARSLGIPLDLEGAVRVLAEGKVVDVDLVKINNDYFANGASIGLPAAVGKATTPRLKRWFGRAAYVITGIRCFFSFHPFDCRVVADGDEARFSAVEVRIVNGAYQGGVEVAQEAHPDSGTVVVQAVRGGLALGHRPRMGAAGPRSAVSARGTAHGARARRHHRNHAALRRGGGRRGDHPYPGAHRRVAQRAVRDGAAVLRGPALSDQGASALAGAGVAGAAPGTASVVACRDSTTPAALATEPMVA